MTPSWLGAAPGLAFPHSPPAQTTHLIRPFGLRNSLRLQSLARRSAPLQLAHFYGSPQSVFWAAVGAPLPWIGSGAATFLHIPGPNTPTEYGFVQAVKRVGRPEADLVRIAPLHNASPAASGIWLQLLDHVAQDAGEHGIQRLYLCLQYEDEAQATVAACGYAPYIQETLFRHPGVATPQQGRAVLPARVRPQAESDGIALQRLLGRSTPPLVQHAEGMTGSNGDNPSPLDLRTWWQPERSEGFVYEENGDIVAAAHLTRGRDVHWLHLLGDPAGGDGVADLLACCLAALGHYSRRPVYCPLRPYQSNLGPLLTAAGFEPETTFTRFVKHTTSMVRRPVTAPLVERVEANLPTVAPADLTAGTTAALPYGGANSPT